MTAPRVGPRSSAEADGRGALSWIQQLLWTGQELHPDVPLYNMALAFELSGALDVARLEGAIAKVIERADALRTTFHGSVGGPARRVRPDSDWRLELVDLSGVEDGDRAARAWMEGRVRRCLDLTVAPYDMALLRLRPDLHIWYVNQHHLITDGWAVTRLAEEVSAAYADPDVDAPALPPFDDHIADEGALRGTRAHGRALDHWRARLGDVRPIPLYGKRAPRRDTRNIRHTVPLGAARSAAIRALATRPEARALTGHLSLFNVFGAALFAFLHRVSGEDRLAFAAPAHNRRNERDRATLGVFIEVFPLVARVEEGDRFVDLLARTTKASAGLIRFALPGASLPRVHRVCNVVLNYIHASFPPFEGLEVRSEWLHPGHADLAHDVRLQVHDFDESGEFVLHFDLAEERFDADERARLIGHFLHLLDAWLDDPERPVAEPAVAPPDERAATLAGWANDGPAEQDMRTVPDAFADVVARTPEAPAVVDGDETWTYAELDARVDRLAAALGAAIGAGGHDRVAVVGRRSAGTLAAMLGAWKAGFAYIPVDPDHPVERLRHVIGESGARALLGAAGDAPLAEALSLPFLAVDSNDPAPASSLETRNAAPGDDAYVLYTSGSTGRPKGVRVSHRALASYASWAAAAYGRGEPFAAPLFTPLTFDLTLTSIFGPLLSGGAVHVYPAGDDGVDAALLRVLADDRVDVVKLTPAHLALLDGREIDAPRVHTLIVGGAELRHDVALAAWRAFGERVTIVNEYGPTEATVGCTVHRFDPDARDASVPIGRPVAGARVYLLDEARRPVPPGVIGEIVVAGSGVAEGYLDRPEETRAAFIEDPARPGRTAYRTGDLGLERPDGVLEFLGRRDRQIKLHGVRVEPAEVESAIERVPGVQAALVELVPWHAADPPDRHCVRCGLGSDVPDVRFDDGGVCSFCRAFERFDERARAFFQPMERLEALLSSRSGGQDHDCIMLYSGGKDSTYALYRLVDMGLRVLALTLDNGFISDEAKANIGRVVEALGIEHEFLSTPHMNEVFVDSLRRHANVCNGCFKVLYTLATNVAAEREIPFIVTGLSRGQFFETRLTEELFLGDGFDADEIDDIVLEARRAYHRQDDAVRRCLDTSVVEADETFERVQFVDFYRFCDVELDELYAFLDRRAPWVRPADTGRSTNCLINDVGIWFHKRERGYHNYALPYSWDVRLGHKERDAALAELDDDIDEGRVRSILTEIGFGPESQIGAEGRLVAYVVADEAPDPQRLRDALADLLPGYMIPGEFVQIPEVPLTENGKIDRDALPVPERTRAHAAAAYEPPRTEPERRLAEVWERVLRVDRVGVHDHFFDLGGDSIAVIQIAARLAEAGIGLEPNLLFRHPTIAELAPHLASHPGSTAVGARPEPGPGTPAAVDEAARARVLAQLSRAHAAGTDAAVAPEAEPESGPRDERGAGDDTR